jgi:inosine-uridine nucleoside N-ribohydrolase
MLLFLFGGALAAPVASSSPHAPQRLIIDTDMSTDCDDVAALCLAHAMMDTGEVELLAVVHDTGLDTGVGAVASINQYYNRPHIPIGAYKGNYSAQNRGSYVDDLVAHSLAKIKNYSQVPDAVSVYRSVLASAPNHSVAISSIGFTTNLEALLRSKGDSSSLLSGVDLIAQKVKMVAWMGGRYPSSQSANPGKDA